MSKIIVKMHQIGYCLAKTGIPIIPIIINRIIIRLIFGCQIGTKTQIGKNVVLGYGGLGIVIHARVKIGNSVEIGSGVTIGGTSKKYGVPIIGSGTVIATGAKILGDISIGKNCVIGANAVVLKSIPDNCVAVGVPARIIRKNIDISNYR